MTFFSEPWRLSSSLQIRYIQCSCAMSNESKRVVIGVSKEKKKQRRISTKTRSASWHPPVTYGGEAVGRPPSLSTRVAPRTPQKRQPKKRRVTNGGLPRHPPPPPHPPRKSPPPVSFLPSGLRLSVHRGHVSPGLSSRVLFLSMAGSSSMRGLPVTTGSLLRASWRAASRGTCCAESAQRTSSTSASGCSSAAGSEGRRSSPGRLPWRPS
jgi:hypothetical protein